MRESAIVGKLAFIFYVKVLARVNTSVVRILTVSVLCTGASQKVLTNLLHKKR